MFGESGLLWLRVTLLGKTCMVSQLDHAGDSMVRTKVENPWDRTSRWGCGPKAVNEL